MALRRKRLDAEALLRQAHRLAWDGQWPDALSLYRQAVETQPRLAAAYLGLAQAHSALGQASDAHAALSQAMELDPQDPLAVSSRGDLLLRTGQIGKAMADFDAAALLWTRQGQPAQAEQIWRKAARLSPNHPQPHQRLAEHLQAQGAAEAAIAEYLHAARLFQKSGHAEEAEAMCLAVLGLAPGHAEALLLAEALREGHRPPAAAAVAASPRPSAQGGPAAAARAQALSELAAQASVSNDLARAMDLQNRGETAEALAAYQRVLEVGDTRPAVRFSLGLLLRDSQRFAEAAEQLSQAQHDPAYALGSHHALADCYRAQGQVDRALAHLIEALKTVDVRTVKGEQADLLSRQYDDLAESYLAKGQRTRAAAFMNSLAQFLSTSGWRAKAREARRLLDGLSAGGPPISLAEALDVPYPDEVLASIALAQEYVRRGLHLAASEECHQAIAQVPWCLPLHLQLAEVLRAAQRFDDAARKYAYVAETHAARGERTQAAGIYRQMLATAPMDVHARSRRIELLVGSRQVEEALDEALSLASTYYQLAQVDKALDTYRAALRLAQQSPDPQRWQTRLLHHTADIQLQRMQWPQAVQTYRQIKEVDPNDERARFQLVDLQMKLSRTEQAQQEIDDLSALYRARGEQGKEVTLLEQLVAQWPDDAGLHSRLARVYLEKGETRKAVAELDNLGELQLRAGQKRQAAETIRQLIVLVPE
ncbi:MAG: tetratricopeptide repeat protein, partial [Chloroflexi bacterium]|nr:tetratricopeptide repeat protein [Chloroflexota bacterium]